jgi:hypothetical protein
VPFRAETLGSSLVLWKSMLGLYGWGWPTIANLDEVTVCIVFLSAIAFLAPNTQEILLRDWRASSYAPLRWRPNTRWAIAVGCLFGIAVAGMISKPTTFLYFRF